MIRKQVFTLNAIHINMSHTMDMSKSSPAAFQLSLTIDEVAKLQLREAFFISQPALTRAAKAIFVKKFGEVSWLEEFKSNVGSKMHEFLLDDGRPFDM